MNAYFWTSGFARGRDLHHAWSSADKVVRFDIGGSSLAVFGFKVPAMAGADGGGLKVEGLGFRVKRGFLCRLWHEGFRLGLGTLDVATSSAPALWMLFEMLAI